jgi:uncharacterized protein YceK
VTGHTHDESTGRRPVQIVRIEVGKETLLIALALTLVIGGCGLVMGLNLAKQSQMDRDFRDMQTAQKLQERRWMDVEAYAMLNGWKIPSDDTHGPTGNLKRMRPQEK